MASIQNKVVLLFSAAYKETTPLQLVSATLLDFGAKIITIDYQAPFKSDDSLTKSTNRKLQLNLKNKKIRDIVLKELIPRVDIIFESYRPGVMERFGLSPQVVHGINPSLIYVRVSGYGHSIKNQVNTQMIGAAGRDMNYLAASGILTKFRRSGKAAPVFPGNILSYYASGSIYVFTLVLQALLVNKPCTVIDCPLTQMMAYTAQPVLLDAHLVKPTNEPGFKKADFQKPQETVYRTEKDGGVSFIFRPGGKVYNELGKANFGNNDQNDCAYTQETI
jgi:crotonobetainyl-CoA:carnitine CoA-transferase CaiB-like acyl-CoA transferase